MRVRRGRLLAPAAKPQHEEFACISGCEKWRYASSRGRLSRVVNHLIRLWPVSLLPVAILLNFFFGNFFRFTAPQLPSFPKFEVRLITEHLPRQGKIRGQCPPSHNNSGSILPFQARMRQFTAQIVFSCLIDVDHLDSRFMAAYDPHTGRQESPPSSIIFVSSLSFFPLIFFLMHPFRAHQRFSSTLALNRAYVFSITTGTFYDALAPLTPQGGIHGIRCPKTFHTHSFTLYRTYSTGDWRVSHKLYSLVPIKPKTFSHDQTLPSHQPFCKLQRSKPASW